MQLAASVAEREAGELSAATLEQVVARIRTEGFVVVDGIVSISTLDELRPQLDLQAAEQLLEGSTEASDGFLSNGLPRAAPFIRPEVVCNPIIEQVRPALRTGHVRSAGVKRVTLRRWRWRCWARPRS